MFWQQQLKDEAKAARAVLLKIGVAKIFYSVSVPPTEFVRRPTIHFTSEIYVFEFKGNEIVTVPF